ncbi:hypothetical protein MKY51_04255 [Solibacillus sp. FSL R5-0691]|uniref:hypothetical protein n=1 Tax=Solibacillus sp. FSL R5-0691 TaxID=2921653 RepID=UPI0030D1C954
MFQEFMAFRLLGVILLEHLKGILEEVGGILEVLELLLENGWKWFRLVMNFLTGEVF